MFIIDRDSMWIARRVIQGIKVKNDDVSSVVDKQHSSPLRTVGERRGLEEAVLWLTRSIWWLIRKSRFVTK